jgi:hypothetical protein
VIGNKLFEGPANKQNELFVVGEVSVVRPEGLTPQSFEFGPITVDDVTPKRGAIPAAESGSGAPSGN